METLNISVRYVMLGKNTRAGIYISGDNVYWGRYCLSANAVSEFRMTYLLDNGTGTLFADGKYVVNTAGVFDSNTGEWLLHIDLSGNSAYPYAMVTSSGNLVVISNTSNTGSGKVYIVRDAI